jgi:hypothetical protein
LWLAVVYCRAAAAALEVVDDGDVSAWGLLLVMVVGPESQ